MRIAPHMQPKSVADDQALRSHLIRLLDWQDAHVHFDVAVDGIPAELMAQMPAGLPYSPWDLLEHMRLSQGDILDFCVNPDYEEAHWPDDYWPQPGSMPSAQAWEESIAAFRTDREALKRLATEVDLFSQIPHGSGQTYLRELLLVADHTSYHTGQLVAARRLLGAWPAA
jgi:hypothetical protein